MTPIGPEDQVDENEVITVTDKETGVTRRYRRRKMGLWGFKNHAFSNDFVQGAIKKMTLVQAACGAVCAVGGVVWAVVWGTYTYLIAPQQEKMLNRAISVQVAPIVKRLDDDEKLFNAHLIDVAMQRASYPTRDDLKTNIDEIKMMIRRLEDRR